MGTGAKKLYCCKSVGRGCPSELPAPSGVPPSGIPGEADTGPYDCNAGYHPCFHCLQRQWSTQVAVVLHKPEQGLPDQHTSVSAEIPLEPVCDEQLCMVAGLACPIFQCMQIFVV